MSELRCKRTTRPGGRHRSRPLLWGGALVALVVAGCSSLDTIDLTSGLEGEVIDQGVYYTLPRGYAAFELNWRPEIGDFQLVLKDPEFHPDPAQNHIFVYRDSAASSDVVKLTVERETSYPDLIDATFANKADAIFVDALKSVAVVGGDGQEGGGQDGNKLAVKSLATFLVDLENNAELTRMAENIAWQVKRVSVPIKRSCDRNNVALKAMQAAANADEKRRAANAAKTSGATGTALTKPNKAAADAEMAAIDAAIVKARCDEYGRLLSRLDAPASGVEQTVDDFRSGGFAAIVIKRPPRLASLKPVDCSRGVCYRIRQPYLVQIGLGAGPATQTVTLNLPNRSPLFVVDVDSAAFVERQVVVDFENGFLQKATFDKKGAELVAVAKLPLEVIQAVFAGLADAFTAQSRLTTAQTELLQKQEALEAAGIGQENAPYFQEPEALAVASTTGSSGVAALAKSATAELQASPEGAGPNLDEIFPGYNLDL